MAKKKKPIIYMIAGANGAGKSTLVRALMPTILPMRYLINPDEIAAGLNPFAPETMQVKAGMLALEQIDDFIKNGEDFAFETTGAGLVHATRLRRAIAVGFRLRIVYVFIASPEMAIERVAYRKRQGGHGVPEKDIFRRYYRSLDNLFNIYMPLADSVVFYRSFGQPGTPTKPSKLDLQCIATFDKLKGMTVLSIDDWQFLLSKKDHHDGR